MAISASLEAAKQTKINTPTIRSNIYVQKSEEANVVFLVLPILFYIGLCSCYWIVVRT